MSAMAKGSMPRPTDAGKVAYQKLLPINPEIATRPMFGNIASFVNGNMFAGLFGEDLFVRLPEPERAQVIAQGGKNFEPMAGRAMAGYVCVVGTWQKKPEAARAWVLRSLALAEKMPSKNPGAKKSAARKSAPAKKLSPRAKK